MPRIYYPLKWVRQSPLVALPGKFCSGGKADVPGTVLSFFLEGHPLHYLTRKVCFVCESDEHAALCPNNITCLFDDGDFEMVFMAIRSNPEVRPNLASELESWARRALVCDPASVRRLITKFPSICPAVAAAIKRKRQLDGCLTVGPASVVYSLIKLGHISLDLINAEWIKTVAHHTPGQNVVWPSTQDIEAFAAFAVWARYLEGQSTFRELPRCMRNRIAINIAFLCTQSFTTLPVLPVEIGAFILASMYKQI